MIRYFGVPVTADNFAGHGWRSTAIRVLSWVVALLQRWLTRLMYEVELREAQVEAPEFKARVLEAATAGFERRRPAEAVVREDMSFDATARPSRNSYREGRKNTDEDIHGNPFSEGLLYRLHAESSRSKRYIRGRKAYALMENTKPEEGVKQ